MHRLTADRNRSPGPEVLQQVARALTGGGIVAFPTETLYALSADPRILPAVRRLFAVKHRSPSHPVPFVAADPEQARTLVRLEGPLVEAIVRRFWPGPLTLVLPLNSGHPLCSWDWGQTLAIRVPASALARGLAAAVGVPLPATSANLSGEPAASDPSQFPPALAQCIDLLVDSGALPPSLPSTVMSLAGSTPRILRHGAIPAAALQPFLEPDAMEYPLNEG